MHDDLRDIVLRRVTAITVGCAAAFVFAPTSASAITAIPAVYDNTGIVHEIGDARGDGRNGYRHYHHHHYYGYAPYPPPYYGYSYWPDYYYGGYGYAYPYWSRPGVSVGFSFSN
jgi:hypothetical protein